MIYSILLSCSVSKKTNLQSVGLNIIVDIEVDKLGDYYTISSNGSVNKYHAEKKLFTYSNSFEGVLAAVDVTNPHKLLLFYPEQQTILLLDNSLSQISKIVLKSTTYYSAVGMANDGNIWVYDSYLAKLKKIDSTGRELDESFPIGQYYPEDIVNSKIIDRGNYVIMADSKEGILLFNNMGYFDKKLLFQNVSKPTILKNTLYFFDIKNNCFISKKLDAFSNSDSLCFDNFNIHPKRVIFENSKFYLLENNKVSVFDGDYFSGK